MKRRAAVDSDHQLSGPVSQPPRPKAVRVVIWSALILVLALVFLLVWHLMGAKKAAPAAKKITLHHYRIDETHSNSYSVWKGMGSPQTPTAEQYAQLKAAGQLELLSSPKWVDVSDGKVTIDTTLPRQATSLMRLKW